MSAESFFHRAWYQAGVPLWPLLPIEGLWRVIAAIRLSKAKQQAPTDTPVIVVGNIAVGGTGKTPVVIALVDYLRRQGYKPGIVSRGYGGDEPVHPMLLTADTAVSVGGDETVMMARRTGVPVVVCRNRSAAVNTLSARDDIDVIVSDDGMQHYAMARSFEIAVIDGSRGLGNGHCLPVGPLRETPARLDGVDSILVNGEWLAELALPAGIQTEQFSLAPIKFVRLSDGKAVSIDDWTSRDKVHAVAGIGNPERFFNTLRELGILCESHALPDHHEFSAEDIVFHDAAVVLMTEKDAIKCRDFADDKHWYLEVGCELPAGLREQIDLLLKGPQP